MSARELPWGKLVAALVVAGVALGVVLLVRGGALPDEVQPVAWNREPCAHCRMLIGEPRYAAQLVTRDGDVLSFDDPGCALRYVADHHPAVHRLWFHHASADRWLPSEHVGFTLGATTPMGYGLAARDDDEPGTIDLGAAAARVMAGPEAVAP